MSESVQRTQGPAKAAEADGRSPTVPARLTSQKPAPTGLFASNPTLAQVIYTPSAVVDQFPFPDTRIYQVQFYPVTIAGTLYQMPYATVVASGNQTVLVPPTALYVIDPLDLGFISNLNYPGVSFLYPSSTVTYWHRLLVPPTLQPLAGVSSVTPSAPTTLYNVSGGGLPSGGIDYFFGQSNGQPYFVQLSA